MKGSTDFVFEIFDLFAGKLVLCMMLQKQMQRVDVLLQDAHFVVDLVHIARTHAADIGEGHLVFYRRLDLLVDKLLGQRAKQVVDAGLLVLGYGILAQYHQRPTCDVAHTQRIGIQMAHFRWDDFFKIA